ncbi:aspartate aminotransferase family protein [Neisseria meningitidis]|uniref:aspartate aminotransferase family protein n=1 Tax=Neisseria meningitidis TaxID=487 RepID=UPI000A3B453C|nr:aspartate aminotransferase family protein [Neisseria meningitidis]OUC18851.1 bifunctional succinylornithine transaminase/acetylornithine transaminase [Neisseria meningitidis]OUC21177.1 bifunctional succinylornithine transaminase/acetylornithine transaminase [Neisseria meningitidis]OUC23786.1 bifunctional succinylornithine transaminase/acetylornithine transaminase [Neisseria meningitidis]OUC25693.1 bifunctional succinylornithine transaminase/acetylornithine transaminase [Neisseria meningitidi
MQNYLTPNFAFAPMIPERASGSRVWDTEGREYIDFSGGIAVNALGHCHPALVDALNAQMHKLWHISNIYTTRPAQELAQKLVKNSFADKVFFCNSGAEANEAALKLARKYARDRFGGGKSEIVACINSFHGRTLFTVSVGGQPKYSKDYAPLPQGITHVPFNDIAALEAAVGEQTCAVIIEPIQGESGILPATAEYLQTARRLCDRHNALLILDEVQTGMGHTGRLFAYEHYGIVPDILSSAKALGCGFPIGAMLATETIAAAFQPGTHGSTFGGNPMACAVGSRAFDIINAPETLNHVREQGQKLQTALRSLGEQTGVFKQVRGMGLLLGCVLDEAYRGRASEITAAALKHGVMILVAGADVLRFAPSLLLNDEDMAEGLRRLEHALTEFAATSDNP